MIDLHTHSLFSDGTNSPEELALKADQLGLTAVALTDHDTLDGLPRFLAAQPRVQTHLVPGIEISCRFMGYELHVVGLFVDPENLLFQKRIQEIRRRRSDRNIKMVHRLQTLGIPITLEDVARCAPSELLSRMHFAQALVHLGSVPTPQEAFRRLIGDGCSGHVPFEELTPEETVQWIREAGGVPILAHPGRSVNRNFPWDQAMLDLKKKGFAGFEAYYTDYGPQEHRYFCALAQRTGMVPSGGSDYHGDCKPGVHLGTGKGNLQIPDEILPLLQAQRGLAPSP